MNCPNCHQPISANTRFCGSCGQRVDSAAPQVRAALPLEAVAAAAGMGSGAAGAGIFTSGPGTAGPATPGLAARLKNLLLSPKSEWPVIASEPTRIAELYTGYIVPLAAFAAIMSFVHMSLIGIHIPFGGVVRSSIVAGVTTAAMTFIMGLLGMFLVGLIINGLAPTFGGTRDQRQAMKVAAYSLTPAWLSSVLALSPVLPTLLQFLAGCYGIYVLYLGLPVVMRSARERAVGYTASVVVCCILLGVVLGLAMGVASHFGASAGLAGLTPAQTEATREAQREQGAQQVGNVIGNMLGTDEKGKAGLGAALSNLAKAGEAQEKQQAAGAGSAPAADASVQPATPGDAGQQSPLGAVGGLLNALGGSLGGAKRVEPVDFKTLSAMVPTSLAGMKRSSVKGEGNGAMGVKTTNAQADYTGGGHAAHLEIADVSGVAGLMDLAHGLVQNTSSESDAGYEKDVVIGGRSAHEKYDAQAKKGEISMIVAKRFSVDVSGEGVPMSLLEGAYGDIDLSGLESMKDAGAQH